MHGIARLIRIILDFLVGRWVGSPLEEDYGEASESDIVMPDYSFSAFLLVEEATEPLIRMFNAIDGLEAAHVKKIGQRLREIRVGRQADYRYQVREKGGDPVELRVVLTKYPNGVVEMEFESSGAVIDTVQASFEAKTAKAVAEEEDSQRSSR